VIFERLIIGTGMVTRVTEVLPDVAELSSKTSGLSGQENGVVQG